MDQINEIKKELYLQKPDAEFFGINGDKIIYMAPLALEKENLTVVFSIPFNDKPGALRAKEPAQLLIRWIDDLH